MYFFAFTEIVWNCDEVVCVNILFCIFLYFSSTWNFFYFQKNIVVVKNSIENQISSRKIRQAVARRRSIKYLVNDAVERYICLHNLYTIPNA